MEVDSIEWHPNFAGFNPMTDVPLQRLRAMCDQVQGASRCRCRCLSWLTEFNVDKSRPAWVFAKLALDSYNQKQQKNFNIENLCKLNRMNRYYCMTFRARNAETDECRLFRGLVSAVGNDVMLCEIKDCDTIGGYIAVPSQSEEAHSPYARYNASTKSYFDMFQALFIGHSSSICDV